MKIIDQEVLQVRRIGSGGMVGGLGFIYDNDKSASLPSSGVIKD